MPEATPFTALGRGNGFPFCPARVDVDDYDYWITLGGHKKTDGGSPSQEQIDLSLVNAMKLFWNFNGITCDEVSGGDVEPSQTIDLDEELYDSASPFPFDPIPSSRVCYSFVGADIRNADPPASILQVYIQIKRMYNDGIFIGYGADTYDGSGDGLFVVYNFSWGFDLSGAANSPEGFDLPIVSEYVEFYGMHFVASMRAFRVEADSMIIQSTPTTVTGYSGAPSHERVSSFTFRDLVFYTY